MKLGQLQSQLMQRRKLSNFTAKEFTVKVHFSSSSDELKCFVIPFSSEDDKNCTSTTVNHAMVLVGYEEDYWILKNWWGQRWGERGYMKVKRGVNMCGISNYAAYAVV